MGGRKTRRRRGGGFFGRCSAVDGWSYAGWVNRSRLAGVERQGGVAEQRLKRPAGGQVDANAAGGLADAGADFEQPRAQSFDLRRTPRLRQLVTEEVDEVVGGSVQQQAEGVGQETMAAQAVGTEAVLELLDAVLILI